ncbi:DUF4435 domain-containing protein [Enterobacter hormaechei]|uniref:DUF4435 domain-containing protein n=1 Tax=Enterobacter hormaechei TaxID=158836 RepID=UPI002874C0E9|nr:DUF4435 domain-containing protein [Enterobacter hormaechei]MDR9902194.1 DUF4435 domain-containing protein [Enterobacter hormaechei subsp. xiangfangensis]
MIPSPTVEELIARYDLEPSLQDIYVEGVFDRDLLRKVCAESGFVDRIVYEINVVDIPYDYLAKYNLTEGNKQRVIALAKELAIVNKDCKYSCVVDRDLDHWFGKVDNVPRLYWTEYCSMELYFFNEEFIKNSLMYTLGCKIEFWGDFFSSFVDILKKLYALRLCDYDLQLNMVWVSIEKNIVSKGKGMIFQVDDYIGKLLNRNAIMNKKHDLESRYDEWLGKLAGDPRLWIRGHDFIDLLVWVLKNYRGIKEVSNEIVVQRLLIGSTKDIDNIIGALNC